MGCTGHPESRVLVSGAEDGQEVVAMVMPHAVSCSRAEQLASVVLRSGEKLGRAWMW